MSALLKLICLPFEEHIFGAGATDGARLSIFFRNYDNERIAIDAFPDRPDRVRKNSIYTGAANQPISAGMI